jgi:hypothetical protein
VTACIFFFIVLIVTPTGVKQVKMLPVITGVNLSSLCLHLLPGTTLAASKAKFDTCCSDVYFLNLTKITLK